MEKGLKKEWNEFEDAISLLVKQEWQRDKMVANVATLVPTTFESPPKSATISPKGDGKMMEEIIKRIQDLKLKMSRFKEKGQ